MLSTIINVADVIQWNSYIEVYIQLARLCFIMCIDTKFKTHRAANTDVYA